MDKNLSLFTSANKRKAEVTILISSKEEFNPKNIIQSKDTPAMNFIFQMT